MTYRSAKSYKYMKVMDLYCFGTSSSEKIIPKTDLTIIIPNNYKKKIVSEMFDPNKKIQKFYFYIK